MKPTARLDRTSTTKRRRPTGLGQSTYELWHYHDTKEANDEAISNTNITNASNYIQANFQFLNAVAENTVEVVNNNGGNAHLETRAADPNGLFTYKVAIVESTAPRSDVDSLISQMVEQAKQKEYDVLSQDAMKVFFEKIKNTRSEPSPEVVWENKYNPRPRYGYPNPTPVVHWKEVAESSSDGGSNGNGGSGSNSDSGLVRVRIKTVSQTTSRALKRQFIPSSGGEVLRSEDPTTILARVPSDSISDFRNFNGVQSLTRLDGDGSGGSGDGSNGNGGGGNGSGGDGGGGTFVGGGRQPTGQQAGLVPGVSNATLVIGTAGFLSFTLVAAAAK